jgi:hypothetical protein
MNEAHGPTHPPTHPPTQMNVAYSCLYGLFENRLSTRPSQLGLCTRQRPSLLHTVSY